LERKERRERIEIGQSIISVVALSGNAGKWFSLFSLDVIVGIAADALEEQKKKPYNNPNQRVHPTI